MEKAEKPRVVAIGASAGGLDAFRKLIENLPVDTGMAFVLLSHILRGSNSLLPEILARSTKMSVIQVRDGMRLLANHIYVIPPDKLMEISKGSLHLVPRPLKGANNAIDHFLFSLAEDRVYGSIGIILSGEGSDGAEGIKILKEESGGVTMAQEPASASSKSMPINAIQIDHVDHILVPEDIAHQLASMSWRDSNFQKTPLKVLWMRKPMPKPGDRSVIDP
ncbi:MAG: chemotaxis protein CheB [Opitutaceae bacterium]|nr:chemotaxis protein CheB [Opitutaceae bacterium]